MTSCRSALTRALLVAVLTLAAACGDDAVQVDTAGTPTSAAAPTTTVLDAAAAQRCSELAATMADATATLGSEVQLAVAAGPTPGLENAVGVARDAVTAFAFEFSGEPFDTHVSAFLEGLGEVPVPSAGDDGVSVPPPGEAAVGAVEQMRTAAADLAATCTAE